MRAILVRRHTLAQGQTMVEEGKSVADDGQADEEEDTPSMKDVYVLAKDLAVDQVQIRRLKGQWGTPTPSCEIFCHRRTTVCFVDFVILLVQPIEVTGAPATEEPGWRASARNIVL